MSKRIILFAQSYLLICGGSGGDQDMGQQMCTEERDRAEFMQSEIPPLKGFLKFCLQYLTDIFLRTPKKRGIDHEEVGSWVKSLLWITILGRKSIN